jgi:cyanophycin synthetase
MARQKLDVDSVPAAGQTVQLCETANLSTGGTPVDVTDRLHPAVASVCQRAAQIVGLDVCGVDLVLADISQAPAQGGIIEINAAPGLRMHLQPAEGTPRNVGAAIVDAMYRKDAAHIPIVAITGTNGKTSTTRMIAHALSVGRAVGMTTSDGIVICGETVMTGDTTGPQSARIVLNDPRVEAAVLETARGGILRRGLGYDDADVAVITNIGSDHIGQDGLETIDDIARVKEVVAEQVRAGGTLVLNADDERVRAFARHAGGRRLAWFSSSGFEIPEDGGADVIERLCYTVRKGWFVEIAGGSDRRIVQVNAVPATLNGAAQFQVENALAAIAACRACGLSLEAVAAAMRSFDPVGHNPGRNNLYRVRGGYVLLDYGHNAHGLQALGRLVGQWKGYALTGVLEAPGDRADWVIEELGREAAAVFDRIVIYEPGDLRGRAAGEVPALLESAARSAGQDNCRVIPDAAAALRECLENMDEREIIVFCYDDLSSALEVLEQHGAEPVTNVPELRGARAGRRVRSAEVQAGR